VIAIGSWGIEEMGLIEKLGNGVWGERKNSVIYTHSSKPDRCPIECT
jgi:hypothetical protein